MIGRSLPNEDDYYRPRVEIEGTGWCQPFTDGPLNNPDNPIEDTYLQLIASAQKMLYITTPYYAVEESMQKALCIAADAGVDVRLVVPATRIRNMSTWWRRPTGVSCWPTASRFTAIPPVSSTPRASW